MDPNLWCMLRLHAIIFPLQASSSHGCPSGIRTSGGAWARPRRRRRACSACCTLGKMAALIRLQGPAAMARVRHKLTHWLASPCRENVSESSVYSRVVLRVCSSPLALEACAQEALLVAAKNVAERCLAAPYCSKSTVDVMGCVQAWRGLHNRNACGLNKQSARTAVCWWARWRRMWAPRNWWLRGGATRTSASWRAAWRPSRRAAAASPSLRRTSLRCACPGSHTSKAVMQAIGQGHDTVVVIQTQCSV